jgi:hypothetical protein
MRRRIGKIGLCVVATLIALACSAAPAFAEGSPWWHLSESVRPARIAPDGEGTIVLQAVNLGDASTSGAITLSDVLPAGVTVAEEEVEPAVFRAEVSFFPFSINGENANLRSFCHITMPRVTCTLPEGIPELPYENITMHIGIKLGAVSGENVAEVAGGGALPVKVARALPIGPAAPSFGVEGYELTPEEEGGAVDAQAGSHPFQLTTTLMLNQTASKVAPPALPKDLRFQLPAGLVGNATAIPQCSEADFKEITSFQNHCPPDTAVGVATTTFFTATAHTGVASWPLPLFNLVPAHGEPARFGFNVLRTPVTLDTSVRSGGDYGVTVSVENISQTVNFIASSVSIWGVPGDPAHDQSRGWACLAGGAREAIGEACVLGKQESPPSFLTLPSSCAAPFSTTVEGESWPFRNAPEAEPKSVQFEPSEYSLLDGFGRPLGLTGCNRLAFAPSIEAAPDVQEASKPSGLTVNVRVPQEGSENGAGLASSNVKDITVALPVGMSVNPAGAGGLEGCSEGQIGAGSPHEFDPQGEPGDQTFTFTPTLPEALLPGLNLGALGFCPDASKIGTVKISSPLISNPLNGFVYLATQNTNPFGSLLAMYIVAEDPVSGTLVKLPGKVTLCQSAGEEIAGESCGAVGQLIATFEDEPQLPFEDAELHFFGGERAPLSTPAHCGTYTTLASFAPWSAGEPVTSTSTFAIEHGPGGGSCPGAQLPFDPTLTGGSTNINAGSFTPLTTTIGREDGQQDMQSVQLHFPPGLSGLLSSVKLCGEPQASEGMCGPESLIGETTVSAGVGGDPVSVKGGKVYITGAYNGTGACATGTGGGGGSTLPGGTPSSTQSCAPYGLSIVNPVKTGPFDLEHDTSPQDPGYDPACDCVVVRAKIEVDPLTAALTVTTDPSGPHAIPHLIDGVPVQIQKVNVLINRPGFTFNPTDCDPSSITGQIASDEGVSSPVSVPAQVTNCAALKFAPKLAVSTAGKTSRANGASLHVKLTYPKAPFGSQANIKSVKVDLPKQLPSRLTTLQKACPAKTFEANPAGCPADSIVGHAVAITPLIPVPLTGPAYFVSHGGAKFPELVIVLQGYGVTIDLHGETFISKAGITSSTFHTVPDAPVGSFELSLPEGKYSALAANGNLCKSKLAMPTAFVAQNGIEIHESTKVGVRGCPPARPKAKKSKKERSRKK